MALLLVACDEPSAPSAGENDQLDNAAELLDEAPDALADIDENAVDGPPPDSPDPSP